jgi:hypothetical protein
LSRHKNKKQKARQFLTAVASGCSPRKVGKVGGFPRKHLRADIAEKHFQQSSRISKLTGQGGV